MTEMTMINEPADHPDVVAFPPAMYGGTLALGLILQFIFPVRWLPRSSAIIAGTVLVLGAGSIAIAAFRAMGRARTAVDPSLPTTAIVSTGPFRFSRNPIYLSLTLLYVGLALLFHSLWPLLLLVALVPVVQHGVIRREERYLERKFGAEYLRYKARVRRWV